MNFCPDCGSMILHGTRCNVCGADIDAFRFEKLEIDMPNCYISNRDALKNDYDSLLKLIINKNQVTFEKNDIIQCADKIIDSANEKYIKHEKKLVLKNFNQDLNLYNDFVNDEQRAIFKSKYNKLYFNFYNDLNMDDIIDKYNIKIINSQKEDILVNLPNKYISYSEMYEYKKENNIQIELDSIIEEHNDNFIKNQMKEDEFYFNDVVGKSLDKNQCIAVLTDDDATQIVAGAGTGKTLTIQAKVKYLIEKQGISPEDILCISFSNSARDDLAGKLEKTIGNAPVKVRTFHSLGYGILGVNGEGRDVPKQKFSELIDKYFREFHVENPDLIKNVVEFFAYYFNLIHINNDNLKLETIKSKLNSLDEYDEYLSEYLQIANVKRRKEYMASVEELIIANYLFIHNINYEHLKQLKFKDKNYDKFISIYFNLLFGMEEDFIPYNIKLDFINEFHEDFACKIFDEYPSFFLPNEDVYINLLSINADWENTLDDDEKIKFKINLNKTQKLNNSYKTKLLTLFDNDDVENLLRELQDKLLKYDVNINEIDYEILFNSLISQPNSEYNRFKKTVESFINLFKGNALNINDEGNDISKEMFKTFINENHENYTSSIEKRNRFFLNIIEKIYEKYTKNIKDVYIDFNDMINEAVIALRKGAYIHDYKYVIVDEYQDTSYTRYNLLKEIQNVTGAKIVVVGDDWQSIYGFTGCDVNLFSRFNQYFNHSKMVKIDVTRRNSQVLIDIVGDFIQENKNQIPKKLLSDKIENKLPIKLFEHVSRAEEVLALIKILEEISEEKSDANILILGRNNRDIYDILCREIFTTIEFQDFTSINYVNKPELNIEFRTVHKSKGLERDYVVVLNLNNQINGFPNKIVNDPVLDFVNYIENEDIKYPEERRLFYVALTRTKNDVYLFSKSTKPSEFVNEIRNRDGVEKLDYTFSNQEIMFINTLLEKRFEVIETDNICPKCGKGSVNLIVNNEKGTSYFRCSNFCGWKGAKYHNNNIDEGTRKIQYVKYAKVCSKCHGMLVVKKNRLDGSYFLGCASYNDTGCNETERLPYGFDVTSEEILDNFNFNWANQINRTRSGVFYIDKYIPKEKYDDYDKQHVDFSKELLGFKNDMDDYSVNLFTKDLMEFILKVSNNEINDEITNLALIAVPSSKTYKTNNSIKKSIDIIEEWYTQGELESDFEFNRKIINYKDLLKHIKDVPTAHLGEGRATSGEQIDSIKCMQDNLSDENTMYIILDDITTTGNSMRGCNEILLEKGINKENILNIAIGATVRDDNEEI